MGEFQRAARTCLAEISARNGVAVLVGGTGLYLRAVVDDLELPGRYPEVAAELDREPSTSALHARLAGLDPAAAARMEPTNRRRILRALEVTVGGGRPFSSYGPGMETYEPNRFVQVALRWERADLDARIEARYRSQMDDGFLDEVRDTIARRPGRTAAQALGYRELARHLAGECSLDEAVAEAVLRTKRFARRQERWFRRDPRIHWFDMPVTVDEVLAHWDTQLANGGA
ncbi:MAG: tRNA dimethylallyltransferase [Acidimicrobiales bacterium]